MSPEERIEALATFYELLDSLQTRLGGYRQLGECNGRMIWPGRGVYFFFDPGEQRRDGGRRVVRVGTHGLTVRSNTTLWQRLSQHRGFINGRSAGGGNHRGSIFRLHVGEAMIARDGWTGAVSDSWPRGRHADLETRTAEQALEEAVSAYIRNLPFLWLAVDDPPGPTSERAVIESGSIALLSGQRHPIDESSATWLGHSAQRDSIRQSGLWNVRHVDDAPTGAFLAVLERHINAPAGR
jgi:hypothetical protein